MDDVQDRIIAHLNGDTTDDEARELSEWIRESPANAKEFARISLLHGQLRNLLAGERKAHDSGIMNVSSLKGTDSKVPAKELTTRPGKPGRFLSKRSVAVLAAMAAMVLIALGIYFGRSDLDAPQIAEADGFATIRQLSQVTWKSDVLSENDRVGAQTLELTSGIVRLQFDNGVDITLEGPARYELSSSDKTSLTSGVLVATVPPDAEGFSVDTPSAKVIDLGTSFGVSVGEHGVADVYVFDGEVEVVTEKADEARKITEGESIRLDADGGMRLTEFNAGRFEKLWPISSGIIGSTETFEFVPPWPRRHRFGSSDEKIFLAPEGFTTRLAEPLKVNISSAGDYTTIEQLTPSELPAGERVRSFMMQYLPTEEAGRRRGKKVTGSITFEQPVLGLIVLHDELVASNRVGRPPRGPGGPSGPGGPGGPSPRRQLELLGRNGDRITLSEDRRTVTVELTAPRRSPDLIRVIVEGSQKLKGKNKPSGSRKKRKRHKKRDR